LPASGQAVDREKQYPRAAEEAKNMCNKATHLDCEDKPEREAKTSDKELRKNL
jgi:hypothetical protein